MTYSRVLDAHYHWRWCVSLPSSGWDRVVPHRYGRQAKGVSLGLMLGLRRVGDLTGCFVGEEFVEDYLINFATCPLRGLLRR